MSDEESPSPQQATTSGAASTGSVFAPFLPDYAFKPPEPVKLAKNGTENWKIWKQLYKHYCVVTNAGSQSPDFQKSLLISTMGLEALQNHFSRCCPTSTPKPSLHAVDGSESDSSAEMVFSVTSESVNFVSNTSGRTYAKMELKDRDVMFQVDCGATVNVISQKYVHNESLKKSNTKLTMYNKTTLKPIGKCRIIMRNPTNGKTYNVLFEVVKEDLMLLLSRKAAEQIQLITVNYDKFTQFHGVVQDSVELYTEYKSVFNDSSVGQLPGNVTLKIDNDAKPVQCPSRRVPISVKPDLEKELEKLVNLGVLKPVTEPTEWCSQISVQKKKNGKLRVCIDPRSSEVLQIRGTSK